MMFRKKKTSRLRKELFFVISTGYLIWNFYLMLMTISNHLNIKVQSKNQLFPSLINLINAFKMKLKVFISQLENEDVSQFSYIK